ncbi:MAG: hypothetical protein IPN50_03670 [Sphingomonadales bacterium]|jgi:hypothetical protein|nr:hypothetical protein [Sphingomonadales bacterium]MBK9431544.1 hypothetical protein [Sphingomonadales bacterium]
MTCNIPIKKNTISSDGTFLKLDNFADIYNKFGWYGIYNPDFNEKFLKYLEDNEYYILPYDLNSGFGEPLKFKCCDKDILFFGCYVFYNKKLSLMYNWFNEILIINDAVDIFLPIYGKKIREYSQENGGVFNDLRAASESDFLLSLSNIKS